MLEQCHILVVGAGPAGTMLAWKLARRGFQVLIIDRAKWPRYKTCGGGITRRAKILIPFDISPEVEAEVRTTTVAVDYRPVFRAQFEQPVIYMVMREAFDDFLLRQAVAAGATFMEQTRFRALSGSPGNLKITTSKGLIKTNLIVGADGVNSQVGRALGLSFRRRIIHALEAEVYIDDVPRLESFHNQAYFDFGIIPNGYAWVFPKKDHLSLGLGTSDLRIKDLRPYLAQYLVGHALASGGTIRRVHAALIPNGWHRGVRLADHRGILIGDAAGWTDPVTMEGIYFGLKATDLAVEAMTMAMAHGWEHLYLYNDLMNEEFGEELRAAHKMAQFLYRWPRVGYWLLQKQGKKLGEYMVNIMTGQTTYQETYQKARRPGTWLRAFRRATSGNLNPDAPDV